MHIAEIWHIPAKLSPGQLPGQGESAHPKFSLIIGKMSRFGRTPVPEKNTYAINAALDDGGFIPHR
jgi:hypothetical protein